MSDVDRFMRELERDYAKRFPRSREWLDSSSTLLDATSHAIRWNEPFMPVARRTSGAILEDLDGHHIVDYWQGHMSNLLGHNPAVIRSALRAALDDGRGLQSGMIHPLEREVAELICSCTGMETARLTTSGSLGTFYAVVLARAFTGRDRVLKVSGGWHGSQPFGLKGVSAHGTSFDHLESEGLSTSTGAEIELTRFNDVEMLRRQFEKIGDRIACFLIEPVLGSGGGMPATTEYLREVRRLTEKHGVLMLCDEIITGFRFRAGDLSSHYGVRPDLMILGKVMGGGMPVAAVAGRADVMRLATREVGRVKFEGGTYSAHELSLVAAKTLMLHVTENEREIYGSLADKGRRLREGVAELAGAAGFPLTVLRGSADGPPPGSLVLAHVTRPGAPIPTCPEDLVAWRHPVIGERLLKAALLLEDVSVRNGIGAISTAHDDDHLQTTLDALGVTIERFQRAGLV